MNEVLDIRTVSRAEFLRRLRGASPQVCRQAHDSYVIIGTDYGYLHDCHGNVRTWKTRSGATNALRRYIKVGSRPQ